MENCFDNHNWSFNHTLHYIQICSTFFNFLTMGSSSSGNKMKLSNCSYFFLYNPFHVVLLIKCYDFKRKLYTFICYFSGHLMLLNNIKWSDMSFRAGGFLSRGGPGVCRPGGGWRKWGLIHEGSAWRTDKEEQRGAERALEESHPAADSAAEDGEGEPETARWVRWMKGEMPITSTHTHKQTNTLTQ